MRLSLPMKIAGGLAVVAVSFLITNFILYTLESRSTPATRDAKRIEDVRKLKQAIGSYHAARNAYPADLKLLVDGGYLTSIPTDPIWANTSQKYQYYSNGVNNYGLLLWLEQQHGDVPAGASCRTGVGTREAAMWSDKMPDCPF